MSAVPERIRALAEPIPRQRWSAALADAVAGLPEAVRDPDRPPGLFSALARAGDAFDAWWAFARSLLAGTLTAADRELVILRTSWNEGCGYEWGHHVLIAEALGLPPDTIAAVAAGTADRWSPRQRALLHLVDDVCSRRPPAAAVWADLLAEYSEAQLVEIMLLIGNYRLLADVVRTLGVPDERGHACAFDRYGRPATEPPTPSGAAPS